MALPNRWSLVDQVVRSDKRWLDEDDLCLYYLQKDSLGYSAGPHADENQLIINFKHDLSRFGESSSQAYYKERATRTLAHAVSSLLLSNKDGFADGAALVPIPTSKPRKDSAHDFRMDNLCKVVEDSTRFVTFCPAFDTLRDMGKAHTGKLARDPDEIARNLRFDNGMIPAQCKTIMLIDDVLTTGSHFAACRSIIRASLSEIDVIGLFLSVQLPDYIDTY